MSLRFEYYRRMVGDGVKGRGERMKKKMKESKRKKKKKQEIKKETN